jgi:PAS domain S-box-containing protein
MAKTHPRGSLLIVDDEVPLLQALCEALSDQGFHVVGVTNAAEALAELRRHDPDLLLSDLIMPQVDGIGLLKQALTIDPDLVGIVMTGQGTLATAVESMKSGAFDYILKPFRLREVLPVLDRAMELRHLRLDRRRILGELAASEANFRNLIESLPDGMVHVDQDGRIVLINEQAERMFGYAREELIGQSVELLVPEKFRAAHVVDRAAFIQHPKTRPMGSGHNLVLRRKGGSEVPVDICLGHHQANGRTFVIAAVRDISERRRMEEELRRAKEEAERAYQRLRCDLEAAARVQRSLLPTAVPALDGIRFAWVFLPCAQLGGDMLNAFRLDGSRVGFYVLDVSGHGVAAALLSVNLARLLVPGSEQATSVPSVSAPADVAQQLNRWAFGQPANEQFFTLIYGVLDVGDRQLHYASAGHPGFVQLPAHGTPVIHASPGYPIGWVEEPGYEERVLDLNAGDRLFFYSDGMIEAMSPHGEAFGLERFCNGIVQTREQTIEGSVRETLGAVQGWSNQLPQDDLSLLALEIG